MIEINFNGEFGWELLKSVPYAYYLHVSGVPLKTISCLDTKCLYYFSENHEERHSSRIGMSGNHWMGRKPFISIHRKEPPSEFWIPPPYKTIFKQKIKKEKPIFVISNKFNKEWGANPINYISKSSIIKIVNILKNKYKIYYNRPTNIVQDNSKIFDLKEKDDVEKSGAVLMEKEYENYKQILTFNEFQMSVFSECDDFISVQGGGSILSSYFGGSNMILARRGQELTSGSYSWYEKLSGCNVSVFNSEDQMIESIRKKYDS